MGNALVRSTARIATSWSSFAPSKIAVPRCTETPFVNSATYHLTSTVPAVTVRAKVRVVESRILPETVPSLGEAWFARTSKTRNARLGSTAVIVAFAAKLPAAICAAPFWTVFVATFFA